MVLDLPMLDTPEGATIRSLLAPWAGGRVEDKPQLIIRARWVDWDAEGLPPPARALSTAPNRDQGYAVMPVARGDGAPELHLLASTPRGMLHAARTLAMLVDPTGGREPSGAVAVPLVEISDWPDLADRGLFGSRAEENLEWLAGWKFNFYSESSHLQFAADGEPPPGRPAAWPPLVSRRADLWETLPGRAAQAGMDVIPRLSHVGDDQFLLARAIRLRSPGHDFPGARDILAVPDPSPENKAARGLCWSNPRTISLIAEALRASAALAPAAPPVVEVWMTEAGHLACFCDGCHGQDGFLLEARGVVRAFEQARRDLPALRLILMSSLGSAHVDEQILDLLPAGAEFRCYTYRSYSTDHRLMLPEFLKPAARGPRDASALIQITPSFFAVFPGSIPQYVQFRAREFQAAGLRGLMTYCVPDRHFFEVNNAAAAEWSWNAHGRSVREFARAFATVTGMSDPERYAEWVESAGAAAWRLADSRFIESLCMNPRAIMNPLFEEYPQGDQRLKIYRIPDLDRVLEKARQAMALAERAGDARLRAESGSVLAALYAYELAEHIRREQAQGAERGALILLIGRLEDYAQQIRGYGDAWFRLTGWPAWPARPDRVNLPQQALLLACDAWRTAIGAEEHFLAGIWSPAAEDAELTGAAVVEVLFEAPAALPPGAGAVNIGTEMVAGDQVVRYRNTSLIYSNAISGAVRTVAQHSVRDSYVHVGSAAHVPEDLRSSFLRVSPRASRRANDVLALPPRAAEEQALIRMEFTKFENDPPFSPETVIRITARPAWIFDEHTPSPLDRVESWK